MRNGAKIQILLTGCNFHPWAVPGGTIGQKRPLVLFDDLLKTTPEKAQEFTRKELARVFIFRKENLFLYSGNPVMGLSIIPVFKNISGQKCNYNNQK
jgi:hypothetical protein